MIVFLENFAPTDICKEMWIPNTKGLKHLNTVFNYLPQLLQDYLGTKNQTNNFFVTF